MCKIPSIVLMTVLSVVAIVACAPPILSPPTALPPTPTTAVPTEQIVLGQQGPKQGAVASMSGLPAKGEGDSLSPINEEGGTKIPVEQVALSDPGSLYREGVENTKALPDTLKALPSAGPKNEGKQQPETRSYGQAWFRITSDGIVPDSLLILDGELVPSESIDGEFVYVFSLEGQPEFVGSFRDPLLAVGLPQEPGQGYSETRLAEGYFSIFVPEELLVPERLATSTVEFYRLDPTVPYTFTLTSQTVPELFVRSEPVDQISGALLADLLEDQ